MSPKIRIKLIAAAAMALSATSVTVSPIWAQRAPVTKEDGYIYRGEIYNGEHPVKLSDFLESMDKLTIGINTLIDTIDKDGCISKKKYDAYLLSINNGLLALDLLDHDIFIMSNSENGSGIHYINIKQDQQYQKLIDRLHLRLSDARSELRSRECQFNEHSMVPRPRGAPNGGDQPDTSGHSAIVSRPAFTQSIVVPGAANPNLAGQPGGVSCCGGDSSPGQSPVLAASGFATGSAFTFSATGSTDGAGTGSTGPDGAYAFNMTEYGTGVAPANGVGVLGLVGVFLSDATPSGGREPARLDFSRGLNFASLSPGLNQIFWIGDGHTKAGATQRFIAPPGATRLYLGTVDGTEWNNNTGSYHVTIHVLSGKL